MPEEFASADVAWADAQQFAQASVGGNPVKLTNKLIKAKNTLAKNKMAKPAQTEPAPRPHADIEDSDAESGNQLIQEALRWSQSGWTAQVIKNEDDDGWAVAMTMEGESEPSLVGPWTMGRDKKNPKPLDASAFTTLVKTANEIVMRHAQQTHANLHKSTKVATPHGRVRVLLDIVPDEDNPHAILSAFDDSNVQLARIRVAANYKFDHDVASAWVASGYAPVREVSPEGDTGKRVEF